VNANLGNEEATTSVFGTVSLGVSNEKFIEAILFKLVEAVLTDGFPHLAVC